MSRKYKLVIIFKSELKKEAKEKLVDQIMGWGGKIEGKKITELKEIRIPNKGCSKGRLRISRI